MQFAQILHSSPCYIPITLCNRSVYNTRSLQFILKPLIRENTAWGIISSNLLLKLEDIERQS